MEKKVSKLKHLKRVFQKHKDTNVAQSSDLSFVKVVLIGDGGVGKSLFLQRAFTGEYVDSDIATIGVDFKIKIFEIDGSKIKVVAYDFAGSARFFPHYDTGYFSRAKGCLLFFDIMYQCSLKNVPVWYGQTKDKLPADVKLVVVGTKLDREDRRAVSFDEGVACAASIGASYIEVSAKNNVDVEEPFLDIIAQCRGERGPSTIKPRLSIENQTPDAYYRMIQLGRLEEVLDSFHKNGKRFTPELLVYHERQGPRIIDLIAQQGQLDRVFNREHMYGQHKEMQKLWDCLTYQERQQAPECESIMEELNQFIIGRVLRSTSRESIEKNQSHTGRLQQSSTMSFSRT